MAFRQLYSAESTCSLVSLSTWSWNTLTWSMKDTTRSADMGEEWKPAAANRGAMWSGRADWAAFRMNSSLQLSLSRATCGCFCVLIRFAHTVIRHFHCIHSVFMFGSRHFLQPLLYISVSNTSNFIL